MLITRGVANMATKRVETTMHIANTPEAVMVTRRSSAPRRAVKIA